MVTTVQLAAGANADVVQGYSFSGLTGTGSEGGITAWSIRDMTIDGNRSAQAGPSWGLRVYGYAFSVENVTIANCYSDGMWTEWAYAGTFSYGTRTDSLEALYSGVKCCFNGGWGWHNRGPHDSIATGCTWFDNNQAGGTAGNLWLEDDRAGARYLAGGLQCHGCHSWGSGAAWGIINDSYLIWSGGEIEGGTYGALLVRGQLGMSGSRAYYLAPIAGITGAGIQLGDDGATPGVPGSFSFESSEVRIASTGLDNFAGAGRSSAPLAWVACNVSAVDVACSMPTVTVAAASGGQPVSALTGGHLFVASTAGYPGTGTIYVATSGGYAQCTYTSVTGGGSPSFNGVTYAAGPGGTVATGGLVSGDPLGGTTPDSSSTVRADQGSAGTSGIRGLLSVVTVHSVPVAGGAWVVRGPTANDILNLNTSSSRLEHVGGLLDRWYQGQYSNPSVEIDGATGHLRFPLAAAPSGSVTSAIGTTGNGASVTAFGNDSRGQIAVTTASTGLAGSWPQIVANFTFAAAWAVAPRMNITPADGASAALLPAGNAYSATAFNLTLAAAPAPGTTYYFNYIAVA
jgi:hypothetical protein